MFLEVDEDQGLLVAQCHDRLVGIGEGCIRQVSHLFCIVALSPFVNLVEGEEQCLLARLLVNQIALLYVGANQLVAPSRQPFILRLQVAVVVTTEV